MERGATLPLVMAFCQTQPSDDFACNPGLIMKEFLTTDVADFTDERPSIHPRDP